MTQHRPLQSVPDDELLRRLGEILRQSRRVEVDLVTHIAEVDERRLFAREASPTMFAYCTELLHLSEAEAYLRIAVARASRTHPMLLAMLADGRLHLTGAALLAPHLTQENREALLKRATHRSKRQIEELIAELSPRPDVAGVVRKLPARRGAREVPAQPHVNLSPAVVLRPDGVQPVEPGAGAAGPSAVSGSTQLRPDGVAVDGKAAVVGVAGVETSRVVIPVLASARRTSIEPIAPARYKVQFTASAELRDKLERLRALMRSSVPDGDLATLIEDAVTEKLQRLSARRFAETSKPRQSLRQTSTKPSSRHVPAAVKRAVRERDQDRCRYTDAQGRRCSARHDLEFHHRHPFGHGGDHSPESLSLLCRAHNQYLAEVDYGRRGPEAVSFDPQRRPARAGPPAETPS